MRTIQAWAEPIIESVVSVYRGRRASVEKILACLLAGGHVLIEDVPGTGKTVLAKAVAAVLGGSFSRIQATPDLLPGDITGVSVYNPVDGRFVFRRGPIFTNVLLVDEINRATPRSQSALLEAMAERQVSADGETLALPDPFLVMATENPVEFEGTFPLPEAQKDRFLLCLGLGYPDRGHEAQMLEAQRRTSHPVTDLRALSDPAIIRELKEKVVTVHVDPAVSAYILDLVAATRKERRLRLGVSPRGSLALYKVSQALAALRGRDYVVPEDVKEIAPEVFLKRVIVAPEFVIKGLQAAEILAGLIEGVGVPILKGLA